LLRSSVVGNTGEFANRMALDPRTGHLYVSLSTSSEGAIIIIDNSTLAERARLADSDLPASCLRRRQSAGLCREPDGNQPEATGNSSHND
jgi:hypothetical protein